MSAVYLTTAPGNDPVIVEGHFAAKPARVFRAWSEPEEVRRWFGGSAGPPESVDIDFRVGGHWRFAFAAGDGLQVALSGTYRVIEPARRLVFSWQHERLDADGKLTCTPPSRVTVTFQPEADGSFVRLVHEAVVAESGRRGVGTGWDHSFARLAERVSNNFRDTTP